MKLFKVWAEWCQPCHTLTQVMQGMEYESIDIETDEGRAFASKYGVSALPTLVLTTDDGELLAVKTGLTPKREIEKWIQENSDRRNSNED